MASDLAQGIVATCAFYFLLDDVAIHQAVSFEFWLGTGFFFGDGLLLEPSGDLPVRFGGQWKIRVWGCFRFGHGDGVGLGLTGEATLRFPVLGEVEGCSDYALEGFAKFGDFIAWKFDVAGGLVEAGDEGGFEGL